MSIYKNKALENFNNGYSCASAIMCAYVPLVRIDIDIAFKISAGFEGGIARSGNTCGTLNAGVMLLSLKYSSNDKNDMDSRINMRNIIRSFLNDFKVLHKGLNCVDILTEEEGMHYKMHSLKCERTVSEVCDLLDKYLEV